MIWLYCGSPKTFIGTGFSITILGQSASQIALKNSTALSPFANRSGSLILCCLSYSLMAPAAVRYVHGG